MLAWKVLSFYGVLAVDLGTGVGVYYYRNGSWNHIKGWSTTD
jgi:hypothetical protein